MPIDRNGLEVLDRAECLALLEQATLGRVGVSIGALPSILPVNFRLIDEKVVFRTGVGSKLAAATSGAVIAFEVDDMDPVDHTGWSVVVTGVAEVVTDTTWPGPILSSAVPRWPPLGPDRLVALSTDVVTGRRLSLAATVAAHQV